MHWVFSLSFLKIALCFIIFEWKKSRYMPFFSWTISSIIWSLMRVGVIPGVWGIIAMPSQCILVHVLNHTGRSWNISTYLIASGSRKPYMGGCLDGQNLRARCPKWREAIHHSQKHHSTLRVKDGDSGRGRGHCIASCPALNPPYTSLPQVTGQVLQSQKALISSSVK